MANIKMHKLNVKVVSLSLGLFGIIAAFTGVLWHGFLGQPSVIDLLYPGFTSNPINWLLIIIASFFGGLLYGALFAWVYNWVLEKWGK